LFLWLLLSFVTDPCTFCWSLWNRVWFSLWLMDWLMAGLAFELVLHQSIGKYTSFVHSFIHSFNGSSTCWMVHSFALSIHLLDGSFLHPSIHPSIHSLLFLLSWWWWCVVLLAKLFVQISAAKIRLVFRNRVFVCVCVCVCGDYHLYRLLVKCCVWGGFEWAFLVSIWSTIEDF
jgi:hypothetical protein